MMLETFLERLVHADSIQSLSENLAAHAHCYKSVIESLDMQVRAASQYSPLHTARRYRFSFDVMLLVRYCG